MDPLPLPLLATPPLAPPPSLPAARPGLSVVVVNYRQWRYTAALVECLHNTGRLARGLTEVVVIDNHSPDDPLLHQLPRLEGVSLERFTCNRGFAQAVNEGCRRSRGDWLLLLNPDVSLPLDFLERVAAFTEGAGTQERRLGIVGLGLRNPDGSPQRSAGPFPTLLRTLGRLLLPRSLRKYTLAERTVRREVDWVTGCCLLVRRECWQQLGGFDPEFFLYYEDVDLCRRARTLGWKVCHEPAIAAVHHHPLHARPVSPYLRLITRHALLTYARKHWPGWQFQALASLVRGEARLRAAWARWRGRAEERLLFVELGQLAQDLASGRRFLAGRRLLRIVQRQEERGAATVPGDSEP
jgi:GT2 family glycosyltransferase